MNICLSHQTLADVYCKGSLFLDELVIGRDARTGVTALPAGFAPEITAKEAIALAENLGVELPIHTIVSDASLRSKSSYLHCHVWDQDAAASGVFRVANGLYACSPEALFLQMGSTLDVHALIRLGFDLCGTYRRGSMTQYNCSPFTSRDDIASYLEAAGSKRGSRAAKRALLYVRDNSFSPKETDLSMKLGLPSALGGEGLGMPLMNHRVVLSDEAACVLGQRYCMCDLYWPKRKVDVEFNGYDFHHGREQNTHDRKRELALSSMGITVLTATNEQLMNASQFEFFSRQVAKAMGIRIRHRNETHYEQRHKLDSLLRT